MGGFKYWFESHGYGSSLHIPPARATSRLAIYLQGTKSNAWLVFEGSCISRGFDEELLDLRTIVLSFKIGLEEGNILTLLNRGVWMLCGSCDVVLWQWQLMHNSPCKERGSKLYCFHGSGMCLDMQNLYLPKMHIWNKIAIIEKMTVLISERN